MEETDRAAGFMARLVQDLLWLARSDEGQLGKGRIVLPIREAVARAIPGLALQERAPLRIEAPDEEACVWGNEDEIVRLFTNLIDNAARYTPPEGTITITARREGSQIRVSFADTGPGIPPEHLPHLGERFYRVDPSRSRKGGGAGLGLSICKSIAEVHGGRIAFASDVGKGTLVTVWLPAAEQPG